MTFLGLRAAAAFATLAGVSAIAGHRDNPPVTAITRAPDEPRRIAFGTENLTRADLAVSKRHAILSVLNVRKPIAFGGFVWDERGVPSGPVWVRVDLANQTISLFRAGHEIGTAVILYGGDGMATPVGSFAILDKREEHRSSLYDAAMPYALRLTRDGVAIHGSAVRQSAATHGCVGVPIAFAALMFKQVKVGDEVVVVPAAPRLLGA